MSTTTSPNSAPPTRVLNEHGLPNTCKPCLKCPYGGPKVGHRGNPESPIVFVLEAPGKEERKDGRPVVGPSGAVFWGTLPKDEALAEWGLKRDELYIINAMQCFPPRRENEPTKNEAILSRGAAICHSRLMEQITAHPRKLIVTLGNHALRSITGNSSHKITRVRGRLLSTPYASIGLLPVVHPSALLRGTGNYRQFRDDINYAVELLKGIPPRRPIIPQWIVHETAESAEAAIDDLIQASYTANDDETTGFDHTIDRLLCVGIAATPELVHIFPESTYPLLARFYANRKGRCIWHNGKFDLKFTRRDISAAATVDEDTMLLSYALDESGNIHGLDDIAGDLLGAPNWKNALKALIPKWVKEFDPTKGGWIKRKGNYGDAPREKLYEYLAYDTSNTLQCFHIERPRVAGDKILEKAYTKVLLPASEMLYWIEYRGIGVCQNRIEHNDKMFSAQLKPLREEILSWGAKFPGEEFTDKLPNSPIQLAHLMYDCLKLVPPRRGSRSTGIDTLEALPKHPLVKALMAYRKVQKLHSTYVVGVQEGLKADGRIHAEYKLHGTRTGRLSSRGPNMQNIPRDKRLRGMFYAGKGRVFIKVDLNQAELRSLACLSGDDFLVEIYRSNKRSLHKETAAEFFPGWTQLSSDSKVKDEQLMRAKAVNFGIVYGREAPSLAEEFDTEVDEAQVWIDKWFARSPKAKAFIDRCRTAPLRNSTLITPFGRKKRHWIVTRENLKHLMNEASNFPHQSIASDLNLLGACKARPALQERDVWIVNVVHDETMLDCPNDPETIAWAKAYLIECMESIPVEWGLTVVPFKAEGDVGRRWSIYQKPRKPWLSAFEVANKEILRIYETLCEEWSHEQEREGALPGLT